MGICIVSSIVLLLSVFFLATTKDAPRITFDVTEESVNNTFVGNLMTELNLTSKTNESIENLQFNLMTETDQNVISLFRIDRTTSEIYTKQRVDRESIPRCRYKTHCILMLSVVVRSTVSNYNDVYKASINVIDINDNAPIFKPNFQEINISAATTTGSRILSIEGATDYDTGENNSVKSYELLPQNGDFLIVVNPLPFRSLLNIITKRNIDRQRQGHYELTILARDGGQPIRTGTLTIRVHIIDENDETYIGSPTIANTQPTTDANSTQPAEYSSFALVTFLEAIVVGGISSSCLVCIFWKIGLIQKLSKAQVGLSSHLITDRFHQRL